MSEGAFKINNIESYFWQQQTTYQISILAVDFRTMQTVANLQTYVVCECSCLQWICIFLSVDPVSHFRTVRYKLTT